MISLSLPIEPVAKERPRLGRSGVYTPDKTRRFERDIAQLVLAHPTLIGPLCGPLKVTMRFILKRPKRPKFALPAVRPDADNFWKAVSDALNGILWEDDAQIVECHASKAYAAAGTEPRIEIELERISA